MRITTDHPASRFGRPVVLDDDGELLNYRPALQAVLDRLGWSRAELAERTGFSRRTVEAWFTSRTIPAEALNVMGDALREHKQQGE